MSFNGYVRVLDANGFVLDLAEAELAEVDHEGHLWGGTLKVSAGSGLSGKRLPVTIDLPGRFSAPALIGPTERFEGKDRVVLEVLGNGPVPFN
jgi:hypothetical protein